MKFVDKTPNAVVTENGRLQKTRFESLLISVELRQLGKSPRAVVSKGFMAKCTFVAKKEEMEALVNEKPKPTRPRYSSESQFWKTKRWWIQPIKIE